MPVAFRAQNPFAPGRGFCYNIVGPGGGTGTTEKEVEEIIARAEKIGTTQLVNESVSTAKMAALSVVTSKLGAKSVTLAKLAEGATGMLIATQVTGVDSTGATDSTVGLLKAVEEAWKTGLGLFIPGGEYKIGEGKKTLDLSTVTYSASEFINQFEIYCNAKALFVGNAELGAKPVIKISPPAGKQFFACNMTWGQVKSAGKESNCIDVTAGYSNGFLWIRTLEGFSEAERGTSKGLRMTTVGEEKVIGNNTIFIGDISTLGYGLVLESNKVGEAGKENFQISGNTFILNECTHCLHDGMNIDLNGIGRTTEYNKFFVGVHEVNSGAAIRDNNGNNQYFVGNTNTNTEKGYVLTAGAVAANKTKTAPYVRGHFVDGCTLNGQSCNLVNHHVAVGEVVAPEAGKPVSGTEYENTFERPVEVTLFINEVKKIVKWFKSGKQQGEGGILAEQVYCPVIRILPGEKIKLEFAKAGIIAWNWFTTV